MPREHRAHRWRIASRCLRCSRRLLSACGYRTCSATRDDRPVIAGRRVHTCHLPRTVPTINLTREARRIFGDMLAPGQDMGLE